MKPDEPILELPFTMDSQALWEFSKTLDVWYPHADHATTAVFPQQKLPDFFNFSFPPTHRKDTNGSYFMKLPPRSDYTWHIDKRASAVIIGLVTPPQPGQRLEFKINGEVKTYHYKPNRLYLLDVTKPHQSINDSDHERVIWKIKWSNRDAFKQVREYFFPEYKRSSVRRFIDLLKAG